mmetsp:Transcript_16140/g.21349  ORF Transcript_16140/g.21349 Transcript_16140/m.21349 type:complete len:116 (-) Transcript_16140:271-618(-)
MSSKHIIRNETGITKASNEWNCATDSFLVSYCLRGTNYCRACKDHISKGSMKFGVVFQCKDHIRMCWYHIQCVAVPKCIESVKEINGLEDLRMQDQKTVTNWLETKASKRKVQSN